MRTAIIILMLYTVSSLHSQIRIPDDWDINIPPDTSTHIFARGVSYPKNSERAATMEAEQTALSELSQKIFMRVDSIFIRVIKKNGSDIYEFAVESSEISTRLYLRNVTKKIKLKRDSVKYIAYCLAYIHRDEAERAQMQAENELTAYNVYHYFMNKIPGLKPFDSAENPEGGYHSWLISNTVILSVHRNNALYLSKLEKFVKNISPGAELYSGYYDKVPVRIIYAPSGPDRLTAVFRFHGIDFIREHPRLIIYESPNLDKLTLLNPSIAYITGIENIHGRVGSHGIFARELMYRIQNNKKSVVLFSLLSDSYTSGKEIFDYINSKNPVCRYVIIYFLETFIEPEMSAFRIPPHLFTSLQLLVYDLIDGEIIYSENEKNGIPLSGNGINDLSSSLELLIRRLLTPSVIEKISTSMEAKNELY